MSKEDLIKDLEWNINYFAELAEDLDKKGEDWYAGFCRRKTVEPLKRALEIIRSGKNEKAEG